MIAGTATNSRPHLVWISRVSVVVSVVVAVVFALFIAPLCHCPRYYLILSTLAFVPLCCGPALYRWFGTAFLLSMLVMAFGEHRAGISQRQQVESIRAQSEDQQKQQLAQRP